MKTLKNDWLIAIIIILPLPFIAFYWNQFPEQIPIHFNHSGKPDNYGDKWWSLLLFPVINAAVYLLFRILPYIDPAKRNYALFLSKFRIIQLTIHAFLTFIFFLIAFYALGVHMNMEKVVLYAVMTLFLILGNYMGNIRQNYFIGIRTPWTLANETVWIKTHRLSAKLWVYATLIMMVVVAFLEHPYNVFIAYVLIIALIPTAYSYILFRKNQQHQHDSEQPMQ